MLTRTDTPASLSATLIPACRAAARLIDAFIAARRERIEHRRAMLCLFELRNRDQRLFEETRVDPIDLPPPDLPAISLFPQTVISGFFFEDRR